MFRAMIYKELRETWWIAAVAALAYGYVIFTDVRNMGTTSPNAGSAEEIPFLGGNFPGYFGGITFAFFSALGLWQSTSESRHRTWLFLLHHPAARRRIIAAKLVAGAAIAFALPAAAILIFAAWAATPGTHPSPFEWHMTVGSWQDACVVTPFYFGAFFSGTRPARWHGSRLLPLFAAALIFYLLSDDLGAGSFTPAYWAAATLWNGACVVCIFHFMRTRDFS